jgi:glycosyltransferase involved in cell wall biosynthesis
LRLKGRGREERMLRHQAERLGLSPRVDFVEFSREIEPFLRTLDCLVVPSRWAGFDNVALEGMLAGTPTIASTGTGLDELPANDALKLCSLEPDDMARALREVLALSDADREALARAQRAFVVRELDLHAVAARFEHFLLEHGLLAASAGARSP